jgi:hypothetical protein
MGQLLQVVLPQEVTHSTTKSSCHCIREEEDLGQILSLGPAKDLMAAAQRWRAGKQWAVHSYRTRSMPPTTTFQEAARLAADWDATTTLFTC